MKSNKFITALYLVMSLLIAAVLVFYGSIINGVYNGFLDVKEQIDSLDSEMKLLKTYSAENTETTRKTVAATSAVSTVQTTAKTIVQTATQATTKKAATTYTTATTAKPAEIIDPDIDYPENPLTALQLNVFLYEAKLSEADYALLFRKSLSDIRSTIHTVADAIGFLDYIDAPYYSGGITSFDPTLSIAKLTRNMNAAQFNYLVFYFVSDDVPGMKLAHVILDNESILGVTAALVIPTENGYRVYSPSQHCQSKDNNSCVSTEIKEITISKDIKDLCKLIGINFYKDQVPIKIFLIDSLESKVGFQFTNDGFFAETDNIFLLYELTETGGPNEKKLQELEKNMAGNAIASNLRSALTTDEIRDLVGADFDTVKETISTIPDLMRFLALNNYRSLGHDMNIIDTTISGVKNLSWHFNCEPYTCYAHNFGCCGTTSGLIAAILEGDYPEVGLCGMSFPAGEGGGHVINYIYDGSQYIIWDGVNFVANHYSFISEFFITGKTLKEACDNWINAVSGTFPKIEIFYCYESYDGDYPIGWNNSTISYLPSIYKEKTIIIREEQEDGYYLCFVDVSSEMLAKIKEKRSDYNEKCVD